MGFFKTINKKISDMFINKNKKTIGGQVITGNQIHVPASNGNNESTQAPSNITKPDISVMDECPCEKLKAALNSLKDYVNEIAASMEGYAEYDDSEIRSLIDGIAERVSVLENVNNPYDDTELRNMINRLEGMISSVDQRESYDNEKMTGMVNQIKTGLEDSQANERRILGMVDGIERSLSAVRDAAGSAIERISHIEETQHEPYDDSGIHELINQLSERIESVEESSSYDDTDIRRLISEVEEDITDIRNTPVFSLKNVVDLSAVFKKGKSADINAAIKANRMKVIYVAPDTYYVDGTIVLDSVEAFYCFGDITGPNNISKLKPLSEIWPSTAYHNDVVRSLICFNGSACRCYIKELTVLHDYCGFYAYYCNRSNITLGKINGSYSLPYKNEYKSVFGNGTPGNSPVKRYTPLPDEWYMNSGFMASYMNASIINIGSIENLNYGFYIIETIPDENPDPSRFNFINFKQTALGYNTFNIQSIVCKKGITFDFEHSIELNDNVTSYTTSHSSDKNYIHGNVFNINSFDYKSVGLNTNSIEICNDTWYDQTKDNRRIMFNLIGKSNDTYREKLSDNTFNVNYVQGVYDVIVNAKYVSGIIWNMYIQVNDVYFNDANNNAQRNKVVNTRYYKGNETGVSDTYENVSPGPLLIFDKCYMMEVNNRQRSFVRPNEISVTNCHNIRINQVDIDDIGNLYHSILESNYTRIHNRMYDGNSIYMKPWNEGYTLI